MLTPILLLLACAAHDPPMRPYTELPPAPARATAVQTEDEIVRDLRTVYRALGLPIDQVVVQLDAPSLLPATSDGVVNAPRWVLPAATVRARWGELGEALWGAPLRFDGWTDADLVEAWNAWNTAALARELAHGLGDVMHLPAREAAGAAELQRAIDVEMPILVRLAERGRVPPTWPATYARALQSILAEAPAAIPAALPADPAARQALLDSGLRKINAGTDPSDPAVQAAGWLALDYARQRAATPLPLAEVPTRFFGDDEGARHVAAAMDLLRADISAQLLVQPGLSRLHRENRREDVEIRYDEERDRATVALVVSVAWPAAREPDLLRLINAANSDLAHGRFTLVPGELRLTSAEMEIVDAAGLVRAVETLQRQGQPWIDGWLSMVEQNAGLKETLAAIEAARAAAAAP